MDNKYKLLISVILGFPAIIQGFNKLGALPWFLLVLSLNIVLGVGKDLNDKDNLKLENE